MQGLGKSMFAGDMSIFKGETMVGINLDLNFQQIPRQLLVSMLPPVGSTPMGPRAPIQSFSGLNQQTSPNKYP